MRGAIKRIQMAVWATVFWSALLSSALSQTTVGESEEFKVLMERNIFNRHRTATRQDAPRETPAPQPAPAPDHLDLTGSMIVSGEAMAFFGGSRTEYRGLRRVNEEVAGARVTRISGERVVLAMEDKQFSVPVGGRIVIRPGEEWEVLDHGAVGGSSESRSGGFRGRDFSRDDRRNRDGGRDGSRDNNNERGGSSPPVDDAKRAEIMKRLMERAQKERE